MLVGCGSMRAEQCVNGRLCMRVYACVLCVCVCARARPPACPCVFVLACVFLCLCMREREIAPVRECACVRVIEPILDRHAAEQVVELDSFVRGDAVLIRGALGANPKMHVEKQRVAIRLLVSIEQNVAIATEELAVLFLRDALDAKVGGVAFRAHVPDAPDLQPRSLSGAFPAILCHRCANARCLIHD
jgi:hypothetical protein